MHATKSIEFGEEYLATKMESLSSDVTNIMANAYRLEAEKQFEIGESKTAMSTVDKENNTARKNSIPNIKDFLSFAISFWKCNRRTNTRPAL